MLGVCFPTPRPLSVVHPFVCELEALGLAGFGWGVAYVSGAGRLEVEQGVRRYGDEAADRGLPDLVSDRFLVHLRRPNKLSTVDYADTQPFFRDGELAFCHNGFFSRAEHLRQQYDGRLRGAADSEVGWCFLQDRLEAGAPLADVLREVAQTMEGRANLGFLDRTGMLAFYCNNDANAMWQLEMDDATLVTTALHSDDDSVFRLVYPQSSNRVLLPTGSTVVVG